MLNEIKTCINITRWGLDENEFEYGLFCQDAKYQEVKMADLTEEKALLLAEQLGIEILEIPF